MTTLKGIFPESKPARRKNFIQENVKNLRRMEQSIHINKGSDDTNKMHLYKPDKTGDRYHKVAARVNTGFREKNTESKLATQHANSKNEGHEITNRKNSAPMLHKNNTLYKNALHSSTNTTMLFKQKRGDRKGLNKNSQKMKGKILSDPNLLHKSSENIDSQAKSQTKYKSQAIQTVDSTEIDAIYAEGLIRYPSRKSMNKNASQSKGESNQESAEVKESLTLPSDRGDMKLNENREDNNIDTAELSGHKSDIDYIKLNKERTSVASRMAAHINHNGALPSNYRKGVVPKYDVENILEIERKLRKKRRRRKPNPLIPIAPKVTSPYLTMSARKPCIC